MRARNKIQQEVDQILGFSTEDEWKSFLAKKGEGHETYYHYTTLQTLVEMIKSSSWLLRRADKSNDPLEAPVHNLSLTTSSISSMAMWKSYAGMGEPNKDGVRIELSNELLNEIFFQQNWQRKDEKGYLTNLPRSAYNADSAKLYDIAYWYFGDKTSTDIVFYKGYQLAGHALHYHHSKKKPFPPFFKGAVWRSEAEVRLCRRLNTKERDVYVPITEKQFKEMKFRLSPNIENSILGVLQNDTLDISQFSFPSKQEVWRNNGNRVEY